MNKRFHTRYSHLNPVSPNGGVSVTRQEFKDDCDINKVLTRYKLTGVPPMTKPLQCGDFSEIGDFATVYEQIREAEARFAGVDAKIRARFGNDPKSFYAFVLDPANNDECIKLGLRSIADDTPTPVALLAQIAKNTAPAPVTAPAEKKG